MRNYTINFVIKIFLENILKIVEHISQGW